MRHSALRSTIGILLAATAGAACAQRGATRDTVAVRADSPAGAATSAPAPASTPAPAPAAISEKSHETAATTAARARPRPTRVPDEKPARVGVAAAPRDPAPVSAASGTDTLRGKPAVVGSEIDIRVTLRPASGGRAVVLSGPLARAVGRASGTDVWVEGTRESDGTLRVARFAVRSVDGVPALDGQLVAHGERRALVTADGVEHPIANPPVALAALVGARVWITGPLASGPLTWGVLEPAR